MYRSNLCPVCNNELLYSDYQRFGMCLDCYAEELAEGVKENVVYDFLTYYRSEFKEYIDNAYDC